MAEPSNSPLAKLSLLLEGFIPEAFSAPITPVPLKERPEKALSLEAENPTGVTDPRKITAPIEQFSFGSVRQKTNRAFLKVVAWNMERNMAFDGQVSLLKTHPALKDADIYLFSELDRGCSRSGFRHGPRELAKALEINGAFTIKYVELPREATRVEHQMAEPGEHGVAIFSRLPILEVGEIRHQHTEDMSVRQDQPRLGGATTLWADLQWGDLSLRVYSLHFDAGLGSDPYRSSQAKEIVDHAKMVQGPVLIGGDTNAMVYTVQVWTGLPMDTVTKPFLEGGFSDTHQSVPPHRRGTTRPIAGVKPIIDHLWVKGLKPLGMADIVQPEQYLSDHYPIGVTLILDGDD